MVIFSVTVLWVVVAANIVSTLLQLRSRLRLDRRRKEMEAEVDKVCDEIRVENARLMQEFFADPYNPKWHEPATGRTLH